MLVIVAAAIDVPFVLSSAPVFVIVVDFIVPLFVSVPLFVIAFFTASVPIFPLLVSVPLFANAPLSVVPADNVVFPLFVKFDVTAALNSASDAGSSPILSITTKLCVTSPLNIAVPVRTVVVPFVPLNEDIVVAPSKFRVALFSIASLSFESLIFNNPLLLKKVPPANPLTSLAPVKFNV